MQGRNFNIRWNSFILSAVFLAILTLRLARLRLKHRRDVFIVIIISIIIIYLFLFIFFFPVRMVEKIALQGRCL